MVIDNKILDDLTAQAKASPRLRMNYNFHQSLEDKCHRMLNAVEPGGWGNRGQAPVPVLKISKLRKIT